MYFMKVLFVSVLGLLSSLAFSFELPNCSKCNSNIHFIFKDEIGLVCSNGHGPISLTPWEVISSLVEFPDPPLESCELEACSEISPAQSGGMLQVLPLTVMRNLAGGGQAQGGSADRARLYEAAQMAMFHFILLAGDTPAERALTLVDRIRLWLLFRLWFNFLNGVPEDNEEQLRLIRLAEENQKNKDKISFTQLIKQHKNMNSKVTVESDNHREAVLRIVRVSQSLRIGGYQIFNIEGLGILIVFRTGEHSYTLLTNNNQLVSITAAGELPFTLQQLLFNEPFQDLVTVHLTWNQMESLGAAAIMATICLLLWSFGK